MDLFVFHFPLTQMEDKNKKIGLKTILVSHLAFGILVQAYTKL